MVGGSEYVYRIESVYGVPRGVRVERTLVFVLVSEFEHPAYNSCVPPRRAPTRRVAFAFAACNAHIPGPCC